MEVFTNIPWGSQGKHEDPHFTHEGLTQILQLILVAEAGVEAGPLSL